jgi:hypothetical protein
MRGFFVSGDRLYDPQTVPSLALRLSARTNYPMRGGIQQKRPTTLRREASCSASGDADAGATHILRVLA